MKHVVLRNVSYTLAAALMIGSLFIQCNSKSKEIKVIELKPIETKVTVPDGFSVEIVAKDLGGIRHLAVSKNGDIYANRKNLVDGKAIVLLKDTNKDGQIDEKKSFADLPGTGILVDDNYLYASSNSAVFRYKLDSSGDVIDFDNPEKIVDGLIDMGRDNAKPFVIDSRSNIYVTIGSWNDACREEGSSKGIKPCTILDSAGGIWKFKADQLNQTLANGMRYATGVKNAVAIDWNFETNTLFAAVHGRGGFYQHYPQYYTAKQDAELLAEALYELQEGDDVGWPYVYYDQFKKQKILAPEYGGDGEIMGGENAIDPVAAFPAHFAPNDMLFYTGDMFPESYKNGAFVAFHNQNRELKQGYLVAFVPFKNGKPSGDWEVFSDNYAGIDLANPEGPILHRPCGLAQGSNGELYVGEDLNGTIFRITYND